MVEQDVVEAAGVGLNRNTSALTSVVEQELVEEGVSWTR